ncbi:hypothetical protein ACWD5F_10060 [Streptomyces sp. NPDC002499]
MNRFGRATYGSQTAMRRNALPTYALSVVLVLVGIAMILSGNTKGWICIGLAVVYTAFVFIATRIKASRPQR